jgi:hypothetical protein
MYVSYDKAQVLPLYIVTAQLLQLPQAMLTEAHSHAWSVLQSGLRAAIQQQPSIPFSTLHTHALAIVGRSLVLTASPSQVLEIVGSIAVVKAELPASEALAWDKTVDTIAAFRACWCRQLQGVASGSGAQPAQNVDKRSVFYIGKEVLLFSLLRSLVAADVYQKVTVYVKRVKDSNLSNTDKRKKIMAGLME